MATTNILSKIFKNAQILLILAFILAFSTAQSLYINKTALVFFVYKNAPKLQFYFHNKAVYQNQCKYLIFGIVYFQQ